MKTSEIVKRIRLELGISQAELARQLNVNRCTVCNYESGKRTLPNKRILLKLLALIEKTKLNYKIEDFLF